MKWKKWNGSISIYIFYIIKKTNNILFGETLCVCVCGWMGRNKKKFFPYSPMAIGLAWWWWSIEWSSSSSSFLHSHFFFFSNKIDNDQSFVYWKEKRKNIFFYFMVTFGQVFFLLFHLLINSIYFTNEIFNKDNLCARQTLTHTGKTETKPDQWFEYYLWPVQRNEKKSK